MSIAKLASHPERFRRRILAFEDGRSAFRAWLRASSLDSGDEVLLPAYVGWSPREGSGVLDPVVQLGLSPRFYRLDARLGIDVESVAAELSTGRVRVLVIIHYFGQVDPACDEVVDLARRAGVLVLEDEAHAMLTDLVGGASGRRGDASTFSLHKLLPVARGGCLVLNDPADPVLDRLDVQPGDGGLFEFDLAEIARRRRAHLSALVALIARSPRLAGRIEPLWDAFHPAAVPQTYPVILPEGTRDAVYEALNQRGFGVVSLYHTLVAPLALGDFPESQVLARRILNLPVHQDIDPRTLEPMIEALAEELDRVGRG